MKLKNKVILGSLVVTSSLFADVATVLPYFTTLDYTNNANESAKKDGTISGKAGKDVLDYLMENEVEVDVAIEKLGLKQLSDDSAILELIDTILANNEDKVEQYKGGKDKLFGFFVGQVMKASKGTANPAIVNKLLKQRLG